MIPRVWVRERTTDHASAELRALSRLEALIPGRWVVHYVRPEDQTMTTPFICVLLAFLLIYLPKIPMMLASSRRPEGYDHKHPRKQQSELEGFGARAVAAHHNGFEAFPAFAAAVIISHLTSGHDYRTSVLCVAFVVARTLYVLAYLADQDYLRSAIWGVGFVCTVALFCLPWLG